MKNLNTIFKTLAILLTIILVSCSQEENITESKPVAKSNIIKSARATYDAQGNLYIDNQTDLKIPIELFCSGKYNNPQYWSDPAKIFIIKSFEISGHTQVNIQSMESSSFASLPNGQDWIVRSYSNPDVIMSPSDILGQYGFQDLTPTSNPKYIQWLAIEKTHMSGSIINPDLSGNDFNFDPSNEFIFYVRDQSAFPENTGSFVSYTQDLSMPSNFPMGQNQLHITVSCTVDVNGDTYLTISQLLNGFL